MNTQPSDQKISTLLIRLWSHLSRRRRHQFVILSGLMLLSAIAEVISLGLVLPFLGVLVAPEKVFAHPVVYKAAHEFGITSPEQLVLPLTAGFVLAALVAGMIRIAMLWVNTRLAHLSGADLSMEIYRRALYQPYMVHVSGNSSELISGITGKVGMSVMVLSQSLTLASSVILLGFVTAALIAIDPTVALVTIFGFGSCYGMISWIFRRKLRRNSIEIAERQTKVVKALQEGLGGIRDVLLDGTQSTYCEIYKNSDLPMRKAQGVNSFIAASPRYAMEALGMVFIALLAYGLSFQEGGILIAIPALGALALGAQRLLPALQQGYSAWTIIVGNRASLFDIVGLLDQPMPEDASQTLPEPLGFEDAICFKDVCFRYGEDGPWVLDCLNLTIPKGSRVGFIGPTGSGKSTAIDLLMGLLPPTKGDLLVDNGRIDSDLVKAWKQSIAHVPQSIFLADSPIAENIAFGIPRSEIDMGRVKLAASQARIADFIESGPEGYEAYVGERGIRLSGGQRQRIGIARAFYKQANVLVFDEATSALDNSTEKSVMEAIDGLSPDLTIIIIAHRLSTVRGCDNIIELENGKIIAEGNYEQLLETSQSFRQTARVS